MVAVSLSVWKSKCDQLSNRDTRTAFPGWVETLEALVDLYLEKKDPIQKAERVLKKENNANACVPRRATGVIRSGFIPAKTKHQVNLRDGSRCLLAPGREKS